MNLQKVFSSPVLIVIAVVVLLVIGSSIYVVGTRNQPLPPEPFEPLKESIIFRKGEVSSYLDAGRYTTLYNTGKLVYSESSRGVVEKTLEVNITPVDTEKVINILRKLKSANCEKDILVMDASKGYTISIDGKKEVTISNPDMNPAKSNCYKVSEELEATINSFLISATNYKI